MAESNTLSYRLRNRSPLEYVAVVLVLTLVVCGTVLALRQSAAAENGRSTTPSEQVIARIPPDTAPTALWFGDSFTAGINGIGLGAYPRIVCVRMGWECNVDAQGSTGFLNDGAPEYQGTTTRLANRLPTSIARYRADIVFVDGGRNDLHMSPAELFPAIASYVDAVRKAWPNARLVLIVPTYVTPVPYEGHDGFVAALDEYAATVDATVIDPVADRWYDDVDLKSLTFEDGVHPNAVGNALIAQKLLASLAVRGVIRDGGPNGGIVR
ncbi:lysophospholipase L1-like esterase [Rhodococcus sp. 27YEA15]|uniref:SGNH/GDSL hydrolase family protein n=1 Tax=Rhodococcus sp. 27YEA15 TaxID=3156259 RepID=UPI003C79C025